jgi:hypothetical protein
MREITLEEIEYVSGANGVPGAIVGGAVAATGYIGYVVGEGGKFNTGNFIGATLTGAALGALSGPASVGRTLGLSGANYGAGIIGGGISGAMNGA